MNGLFGFGVIIELIGVCTLWWSRRSAVSFIVAMSVYVHVISVLLRTKIPHINRSTFTPSPLGHSMLCQFIDPSIYCF